MASYRLTQPEVLDRLLVDAGPDDARLLLAAAGTLHRLQAVEKETKEAAYARWNWLAKICFAITFFMTGVSVGCGIVGGVWTWGVPVSIVCCGFALATTTVTLRSMRGHTP